MEQAQLTFFNILPYVRKFKASMGCVKNTRTKMVWKVVSIGPKLLIEIIWKD